MVQVKKPQTRDAILAAAGRLFRKRGYHLTTLSQIAKEAGVSTANVYVYFSSKLGLLYTIYDPWFRARLLRLERSLRRIRDRERRIYRLLHALWCEVPAESNSFVNNVMQAVSTSSPADKYEPALLRWAERRVGAMLREALPPERRKRLDEDRLAHVVMMAVDGFAIAQHLRPGLRCDHATLRLMTRLLLDGAAGRSDRGERSRRRA